MATQPQPPQRPNQPQAGSRQSENQDLMHGEKDDPVRGDHGNIHSMSREERESRREERRRAMEDAPTIANEQLERSREIETMGVTEWQASQDQRPEEDRPVLVKDALPIGDVLNTPQGASKQVPGVSHPTTPTPERAPVRNPDGSLPQRR